MTARPVHWDELMLFKLGCEDLGVETPEAIVEGLRLVKVAAEHEKHPVGGLLGLTDDQVRARITGVSIRTHSDGKPSSKGMRPGITVFRDELADEVRVAVQPDLERIVLELQTRFTETARPLIVAARDFGFTMDTDPAEVIDLADENASAAYRAMGAAARLIQPIAQFRILMSTTFDLSPTSGETIEKVFGGGPVETEPPINWSVLFAEADNWSLDKAFLVAGQRGNQLDWLALARGGLRLNTPDEARAKIAHR